MFENTTIKIWLRDDGILQAKFKQSVDVDRKLAEEILGGIRSIAPTRTPILVDRTTPYAMDFDAQRLVENTDFLGPIAFFTPDRTSASAARYSKESYLRDKPAKVFSDEHEAVAWLLSQLPGKKVTEP